MQKMHTHTPVMHARCHTHTPTGKNNSGIWLVGSIDRRISLPEYEIRLKGRSSKCRGSTISYPLVSHTDTLSPFADKTCWWCQSGVGVLDAQRHYPSQPDFEGRRVDAGAWEHLTKGVHVCMQCASVCVCVGGGGGGCAHGHLAPSKDERHTKNTILWKGNNVLI